VIGTDLDSDLAVLTVDVPVNQIHPLALGSSKDVKVGRLCWPSESLRVERHHDGRHRVARGRLLDSMRDSSSGSNFSSLI
jgi:hypothetical protein